jgi:tetratricopeptide (TPR) repeat protein
MTVAIDFDPRWIRRSAVSLWPLCASFLVTLLGGTVDARAKEDALPPDPFAEDEGPSPAQVLFEAGRDAMKRGEHELACKKFTESYHEEPAPGTLLNLGNCEERQGKLSAALKRYQEAVDQLEPDDPRAAFARKRAEELERKIPTLTVSVSATAPEKIRVTRNGEPLTTELGTPVRLDPGNFVVVAEATGYHPRVYQLSLAPGDTEQLSVAVGERIEADAPPATDLSSRTIAGYVLLATGAASGAASGTFAWLTHSEYSTVRERCDVGERVCRDATGQTAAETGATYETLAYVFGGVAVVSLSIGGYLLLADDEPESEESGQLSLSVVANGSDSPGLVLHGTF